MVDIEFIYIFEQCLLKYNREKSQKANTSYI